MLVLWRHLFLLVGFLSSTLLAANEPRAYDYGPTVHELLRKRDISQNDSQNALVQPISYNGSIPLRPELRELQDYHEQWNLYILALSWMQWLNQSDPTSWYAIAGQQFPLLWLLMDND
jgi:tyrosinase